MMKLRGIWLLGLVAVLAISVLVGCEGKTGPVGPQGEQGLPGQDGPQGEQGPPGEVTRTLMTGSVPVVGPGVADAHFVSIPGLDMTDPPLISVFIDLTPPEWDELPLTLEDTLGDPIVLYASLQDGGLTLYNCQGLNYIMIILE